MSVIKSKRGESKMQFLSTAMDLEVFTLKACLDFSKRYTFLLTNEISDLSKSIFDNVKRANSIYPKTKDEVKLRRQMLLLAYADCQCLISQIQIAYDLKIINSAKDERLDKSFEGLSEEEREQRLANRKRKIEQKRDKLVEDWMLLADSEMKLIKGVLRSDKTVFKHLM